MKKDKLAREENRFKKRKGKEGNPKDGALVRWPQIYT